MAFCGTVKFKLAEYLCPCERPILKRFMAMIPIDSQVRFDLHTGHKLFPGAFGMKTEKSVVRILFAIFLSTLMSESFGISAQSDSASRVLEGAKKEGALVWYTALNLNDSEMLTKVFEQRYPLDRKSVV